VSLIHNERIKLLATMVNNSEQRRSSRARSRLWSL